MKGQRLLRRFPTLWRATRLARRWYYARYDSYPDWQRVLQSNNSDLWRSTHYAALGGPRVLMATAIGSLSHAVTLESALAAALTFRGAEVHALLCDGTMTACAECEASLYPRIERFAEHGPAGDLEEKFIDLGSHARAPTGSDNDSGSHRAEFRRSRRGRSTRKLGDVLLRRDR